MPSDRLSALPLHITLPHLAQKPSHGASAPRVFYSLASPALLPGRPVPPFFIQLLPSPPASYLPSSYDLSSSIVNCAGFPADSAVKNPATAGDASSIPESGRSPGEGKGSPLQHSCLGNPRTQEPSGLQSAGSQRVRHDLATEQPWLSIASSWKRGARAITSLY